MTEFVITVEEKEYNGYLVTAGYGYKIVLFVDDIPVTFEPDEERNFRALVPPEHVHNVEKGLLKKIAEELEINLNN